MCLRATLSGGVEEEHKETDGEPEHCPGEAVFFGRGFLEIQEGFDVKPDE